MKKIKIDDFFSEEQKKIVEDKLGKEESKKVFSTLVFDSNFVSSLYDTKNCDDLICYDLSESPLPDETTCTGDPESTNCEIGGSLYSFSGCNDENPSETNTDCVDWNLPGVGCGLGSWSA